MINILIKTESHYSVDRSHIRKIVTRYLNDKKIKGQVEVSINIVGDRLMKSLNKKYRNLDETTDILSFPLNNNSSYTPFVDAPDSVLRLGDVVLSYPQIIEDAVEENVLVEDKIEQLLIHGLNHLFGNHT